jgi:hypothetical protein
MGREIRRVPADWNHPRDERRGGFKPLYDRPFAAAARAWLDKAIAWDNGTDEDCAEHKASYPFYWQWDTNPPNAEYYRPDWPEESATHYQVYETVSEGTPVTPHFATKAELVDYLVAHGDFWDQSRGHGGWKRDAAERFVERAWAPSLIMAGGTVFAPRDGDPL